MHVNLGGFVVAAILGVICAMIADGKGRSPWMWGAIGFFFPCLGLILILVLPDENEGTAGQRHRREHRRLEERVRMNRQAADQQYRETLRRLDDHDRAIGIDTHGPDTARLAAGETEPAPEPPRPEAPPPPPPGASAWHFLLDGEQQGPVTFHELRALYARGEVGPSTFVWRDSMKEWQPVSNLPDLEAALRA